jgi:hypothetical protein
MILTMEIQDFKESHNRDQTLNLLLNVIKLIKARTIKLLMYKIIS